MVHGNSGVCKVEAVQTMDGMGDKKRTYYTLVPIYTSGSRLFVPTDSKKVVTRYVKKKKEAEKLLNEWDEIDEMLDAEDV